MSFSQRGIKSFELRILGVFLALFVVYSLIAWIVLAPLGYYGTSEEASFVDPWVARVETIVNGDLLYRDVPTTTPPLTNFLLMPPVLVSGLFGYRNPWTTLIFMVYFSLFNLLAAYVLLYAMEDREEGYRAALYFLLNPLTFGNALLRRQDESILLFFFSLALLFFLHRQHWRASVATGITLLIKLTGVLIIPVAFFQTRDWRYFVIPVVVFSLVFGPFLLAAGKSAVFWDVSGERTEHPFKYRGISLGNLWRRGHDGKPPLSVEVYSAILIAGTAVTLAFIAWKPQGLLEDLTLLTAIILLLSPMVHCGYFSVLALAMAPLLRKYRITGVYLLSGLVFLVADFQKSPLGNYLVAFVLVAVGFALLIAAIVQIRWPRRVGGTGSI
jgi:hypothetical protein